MVDKLRNSEANIRRIENVEACFGSSGRKLCENGRVLIGEGVLIKICRKKPKARQFFLFNDLLIYGSIIINRKRYSNQHIIPLEEVKLENIEDEGDARNGWLIKTRIKSFVVYASTPSEKREWMLHIERCIQDLLKEGRLPPSDYAALWVPDKEAVKCMCCHTSHFTVIQRRHHCRACGKVVCSSCSSKSFMLEGISKKPVRVCDTCYNKLCQGMSPRPVAPLGQIIGEVGGDNSSIRVRDSSPINANDSSDSDGEDPLQQQPNEWTRAHDEPTFYEIPQTSVSGENKFNQLINNVW
ncbi:hypothetical protein Mgra_00002947 [Meloidogyne graminicola]|uniref:FYVE-type domain-containing protein n=1 Tax=Meloidogyne graminicola TaxID=189291 RepID=A0A8S9ZX35_9BILA|nr:hypothetical protein Mgra_00002947 [Meloidogyne graminicola]